MKRVLKKVKPKEYIKLISEKYRLNRDKDKAKRMSQYVRHQFKYYGLQQPRRRELYKEISQEYIPHPVTRETTHEMVEQCFNHKKREMSYTGIELLDQFWMKQLGEEDLEFLEKLIIKGRWWDTVDMMSRHFGLILKDDKALRDKYSKQYLEHENMWMRRISLIFQLRYKEDMDQEIIFNNVKKLMGEEEFFIRKAIGWILREHGKRSPKAVIDFVKENEDKLSHLSKVESMKYFHKHPTRFSEVEIPVYAKQRKKKK